MKKFLIMIAPVVSILISYNTFADTPTVRVCNHTNSSTGMLIKVEEEQYDQNSNTTKTIRTKVLTARECTHMSYDNSGSSDSQFIHATGTGDIPTGDWTDLYISGEYLAVYSNIYGNMGRVYVPSAKPEYMEKGEYHCDIGDDASYNVYCNGWQQY